MPMRKQKRSAPPASEKCKKETAVLVIKTEHRQIKDTTRTQREQKTQ